MMVLESGASNTPVAVLPPHGVASLTQAADTNMSAVEPGASCVISFDDSLDTCVDEVRKSSLSPWCVDGQYDRILEEPERPVNHSVSPPHSMETETARTGNIEFAIEIKQDIPVTDSGQCSPAGKIVHDRQNAVDSVAAEIQGPAVSSPRPSGSPAAPADTSRPAGDNTSHKEDKHEDDVVWICFVCAKGFSDQSELMSHQDACEEADEEVKSPVPDPQPAPIAKPLPAPPPLHSYHTRYGHRPAATATAVPTLLRKVGSDYKTLPLGLPNRPRYQFNRRRKKWPEIYIPPSRETYFNALGLGPKMKVDEICSTPRKSVDDDCGIIDLTDDDLQPSAPPTPRTPRSLMSQLSRDDASGRRRHLSFTQPLPAVTENKKSEETSDGETDSSESSQEERAPRKNCAFRSMLSGIPLTSPLGQRLKKYWPTDSQVHIVSDIEQYCSTTDAFYVDLGKNGNSEVMDKLRHRPPPQITFKFTKKYMNKWFHSYKFNSADYREFWKLLKTGLERESRIQLRQMKPCKVVLSRLSAKDIKYWTTPRPRAPVQQRYLPSGQQNYNTVRMTASQQAHYVRNMMWQRSSQARTTLNTNSTVNHSMQLTSSYPTLSQTLSAQDGIVVNQGNGPTPQLLLRTVGGGQDGMRLEVVPILNHAQSRVFPSSTQLGESNRRLATGSQKRKQTFDNVRGDDNISIISLSSDEEEEPMPKSAKCCLGCNKKSAANCSVHGRPKIGPASFMRRRNSRMSNETIVAGSTGMADSYTHSDIARDSSQNVSKHNTAYTHIQMVNGKVLYPHAPQAQVVPVGVAGSDIAGHGSGRIPSPEMGNVCPASQPRPDSAGSQDYMDFEVICIDSSDEDE